MYIKSYLNFIKESYGVSKSSIIFEPVIYSMFMHNIEEFFESGLNTSEKTELIKYNLLKTYIKDKNLWSDFPVREFNIKFTFKIIPHSEFKTKYKEISKKGQYFNITGAAYGFGNKNWEGSFSKILNPIKKSSKHTLSVSQEYGLICSDKYKLDTNNKQFISNIQSAIYHELNHTYEVYKKIQSSRSKGDKRPARSIGLNTSITWADVNKWGIPKEIYKYWSDNFGYKLYYSEPHEMRAMVQESLPFAKNYSLEDFRNFSGSYRESKKMIEFKSEEFIKNISDVILNYDEESNVDFIMNKLKKMFVTMYESNLKSFKEEPDYDLDKLKSMDYKQFIKYFEKIINKAGKTINRKLDKLWYLANSEEE